MSIISLEKLTEEQRVFIDRLRREAAGYWAKYNRRPTVAFISAELFYFINSCVEKRDYLIIDGVRIYASHQIPVENQIIIFGH